MTNLSCVFNCLFKTFGFVKKFYNKEIKLLGKGIKKVRLSKEITQEELADLCEVDVRTVQRIEKGEYGMSLNILFALADALEMSPSELLNFDKA